MLSGNYLTSKSLPDPLHQAGHWGTCQTDTGGAGICQRELLGPGIFGRHPRGLPKGKFYIGLSTRLCSKSGSRVVTLRHWWNQDDRQAASVIFCVWSNPDPWYLISVSDERMIQWRYLRPTSSGWQFGFLSSHNCCSSYNLLPRIPGNNVKSSAPADIWEPSDFLQN